MKYSETEMFNSADSLEARNLDFEGNAKTPSIENFLDDSLEEISTIDYVSFFIQNKSKITEVLNDVVLSEQLLTKFMEIRNIHDYEFDSNMDMLRDNIKEIMFNNIEIIISQVIMNKEYPLSQGIFLKSVEDVMLSENLDITPIYKCIFETLSSSDLSLCSEQLNFLSAACFLYDEDNIKIEEGLQDIINSTANSDRKNTLSTFLIDRRYYFSSNFKTQLESKLVENFKLHGIDFKKIHSLWIKGGELSVAFSNIKKSIETISEIDKEMEGAAALLFNFYGIAHFNRYPQNVLKKQALEHGHDDKKYGLVIFPHTDYNGAFSKESSRIEIGKFSEILPDEYIIRITECSGRVGVVKSLLKMDKMYGGKNKISFGFIGGHGNEDSITFGDGNESGKITVSDLAGNATQRSEHFFIDNPTIILYSCATGAKDGIADHLSKALNANVIAPDTPITHIDIMDIKSTPKGLLFDVEYRDISSNTEVKSKNYNSN